MNIELLQINEHNFRTKSVQLVFFLIFFVVFYTEYTYYQSCKSKISNRLERAYIINQDEPCNEKFRLYDGYIDCESISNSLKQENINEEILSCTFKKNIDITFYDIIGMFFLGFNLMCFIFLLYFIIEKSVNLISNNWLKITQTGLDLPYDFNFFNNSNGYNSNNNSSNNKLKLKLKKKR